MLAGTAELRIVMTARVERPGSKRAYGLRNDVMHQGKLAPRDIVRNLRAELAELTSFTLRHAGLAPIVPTAKQHRPHG